MRSRQFVLYATIGLTGLAIDVALFALLVGAADVDKQLANVISISVAITNNFLLNLRYNFTVRDHLLARFASFYAVGASGIALTAVVLWLMVDVLAFSALAAKVASLPLVLVVQYSLNRHISFRDPTRPATPRRNADL